MGTTKSSTSVNQATSGWLFSLGNHMKLTIAKKPFKGRSVGSEMEMSDSQARLLVKLGRAQYITRDMVAAPVAPVQAFSQPTPVPQPVQEATEIEDFDSDGNAWDADLHVSTKLKNSDGTWRKRPGAKTSE